MIIIQMRFIFLFLREEIEMFLFVYYVLEKKLMIKSNSLFTFTKHNSNKVYVSEHDVWIGPLSKLNICVGRQLTHVSRSCIGTIRNIHNREEKYCVLVVCKNGSETFQVSHLSSYDDNKIVVISKDVFQKFKTSTTDETENFITVNKNLTLRGKDVYSSEKCIIKVVRPPKDEEKKCLK